MVKKIDEPTVGKNTPDKGNGKRKSVFSKVGGLIDRIKPKDDAPTRDDQISAGLILDIDSIANEIEALAEPKTPFRIPGESELEEGIVYDQTEEYARLMALSRGKWEVAVILVDKSGQGHINKVLGRAVGDATVKLYFDTVETASNNAIDAFPEGKIDLIRMGTSSDEGRIVISGENLENYRHFFEDEFTAVRRANMQEVGPLTDYDVNLRIKGNGHLNLTLADYATVKILRYDEILIAFKPRYSPVFTVTPDTSSGFIRRLAIEADLDRDNLSSDGKRSESLKVLRRRFGINGGNTDTNIQFAPNILNIGENERVSGLAVEISFAPSTEAFEDLFSFHALRLLKSERKGYYEFMTNRMRFRGLNILGYDVTDSLVNVVERVLKSIAGKTGVALVRLGDLRYMMNGLTPRDLQELEDVVGVQVLTRGFQFKPEILHTPVEDLTLDEIDAKLTWHALAENLTLDEMDAEITWHTFDLYDATLSDLCRADRVIVGTNYMFEPEVVDEILGIDRERMASEGDGNILVVLTLIESERSLRNTKDLVVFLRQQENGEELVASFFEFIRREKIRERLDNINQVILEMNGVL